MYQSLYVFYRVSYPFPGTSQIQDVELMTFDSAQEENTVTREKRMDGYKTLRVNEQVYRIMEAAMLEKAH